MDTRRIEEKLREEGRKGEERKWRGGEERRRGGEDGRERERER